MSYRKKQKQFFQKLRSVGVWLLMCAHALDDR